VNAPYRLSLTPLAVAVIIFTTAVPVEIRGEAGWSLQFGITDMVQNLLLYVPLGVALWRRPLWQVGAMAGMLSLGIEATQLWSVGRFASPFDVLNNTLGALVAASLMRLGGRPAGAEPATVRLSRGVTILAACVFGFIIYSWTRPAEQTDLSNWDTSYPLLLGNERTENRPWRGTISRVALFDSTLTSEQVAAAGSGFLPGGPLPEFESSDTVVSRGGPARQLPAKLAERFAHVAMAANQFSVLLTLKTDDEGQEGPARILSFSADTFNRNFDLGQQGRRVIFRVRTPVTGLNGGTLRASTRPILRAGREVELAATYDGAVARIYVDGALDLRRDFAMPRGCSGGALCSRAASLNWALAGSLLALVLLAWLPVGSRGAIWTLALAAGLATAAAGAMLPVAPQDIASRLLLAVVATLGAASIALARVSAIGRVDDANVPVPLPARARSAL
jgi:hypothetical protein